MQLPKPSSKASFLGIKPSAAWLRLGRSQKRRRRHKFSLPIGPSKGVVGFRGLGFEGRGFIGLENHGTENEANYWHQISQALGTTVTPQNLQL